MNVSPYLEHKPRTFEEMVSQRDYDARLLRSQVRRTVITLKRGNMPVWSYNYTLDCLKYARKAHSKAILDREAYKAAINERDIQRSLGLISKEWLQGEEE